MAFNDPQTLTIDAVASTLPRLVTGTVLGKFTSPDGLIELSIDPRGTTKRNRRKVALYIRKTVTDSVTGLTRQEQHMVSVTSDRPLSGISDDDVVKAFTALSGWLTASTNANLKKLVGGEN